MALGTALLRLVVSALLGGGNHQPHDAPCLGQAEHLDRKAGPSRNPDGSTTLPDARWWLVVVPLAVLFAFVWAVVLLTYLLPPFEIYGNLLRLSLTRNQALFIGVGTLLLSIEFLFARTCSAATPAPSVCSRAWPGWATAAAWWWVFSASARRTAQRATRPAIMSARCA